MKNFAIIVVIMIVIIIQHILNYTWRVAIKKDSESLLGVAIVITIAGCMASLSLLLLAFDWYKYN